MPIAISFVAMSTSLAACSLLFSPSGFSDGEAGGSTDSVAPNGPDGVAPTDTGGSNDGGTNGNESGGQPWEDAGPPAIPCHPLRSSNSCGVPQKCCITKDSGPTSYDCVDSNDNTCQGIYVVCADDLDCPAGYHCCRSNTKYPLTFAGCFHQECPVYEARLCLSDKGCTGTPTSTTCDGTDPDPDFSIYKYCK